MLTPQHKMFLTFAIYCRFYSEALTVSKMFFFGWFLCLNAVLTLKGFEVGKSVIQFSSLASFHIWKAARKVMSDERAASIKE